MADEVAHDGTLDGGLSCFAVPFKDERTRQAAYRFLVHHLDCGPFDGGCVLFASALQARFGGQIAVVVGRSVDAPEWSVPIAHHAVLMLGRDSFLDADGLACERSLLDRLQATEGVLAGVVFTGVRAMQDGDLPECRRDPSLISGLAQVLGDWMSPIPKTASSRRARPL